jgi:hypothetical protein
MTLESENTTQEATQDQAPQVAPETAVTEAPQVDAAQAVETNAYVPTYKVRPEFKQALLKAIGDLPFNQIAGLVNAIDVPILDHQTLTQIVNAIGQFPYTRVETILKNVGNYVTQVMED